MKTTMLFLAAALTLYSCGKDNRSVRQDGILTTSISGKATRKIKETSYRHIQSMNAYDSMGRLHNLILDSLRKFIRKTQDVSLLDERHYIAYYFKKYMHIDVRASLESLPPSKTVNIIKNYESVIFSHQMAAPTRGYLHDIFDAVKATDSFNPDVIRQRILPIEAGILNDHSLPNGDKNMLLTTTAIVRHSAEYWLPKFKNAWQEGQAMPFGFFKNLLTGAGVILADGCAAAYLYFTVRPINNWVSGAAWFSELGYWSMQHIL